MSHKIKNINLTSVEYQKLGKYKQMRCGNVRIKINDAPMMKEVRIFGKLKY